MQGAQFRDNLFGVKIFVTPDVPKMQLSKDCPVTPEFRVEMNAWMVQFFGVVNILKDGEVIQMEWPSEAAYMNPRTYQQLRKVVVEQGPSFRFPTPPVP